MTYGDPNPKGKAASGGMISPSRADREALECAQKRPGEQLISTRGSPGPEGEGGRLDPPAAVGKSGRQTDNATQQKG